ncbi:hypothetical protein MA16_Dca027880 [Dendrobium catenatum]|uniref:Uncharacterized protein n=1 Tax=Dendrobium catenatum TaxID=906689 RepID=A0A2I0V7D7_9ASPA|nr:hypothetical protein MA16_Dca027880 [Dendrobium catenatum]
MSPGLWKTRYIYHMLSISEHWMIHHKSNVIIYEILGKTSCTLSVSTTSKIPKDNNKYKLLRVTVGNSSYT